MGYDIIHGGSYYDLKTTRYHSNKFIIHRYYHHYTPRPKVFMPAVHPKHRKISLIPQPGFPGWVNRSKSKRKRK